METLGLEPVTWGSAPVVKTTGAYPWVMGSRPTEVTFQLFPIRERVVLYMCVLCRSFYGGPAQHTPIYKELPRAYTHTHTHTHATPATHTRPHVCGARRRAHTHVQRAHTRPHTHGARTHTRTRVACARMHTLGACAQARAPLRGYTHAQLRVSKVKEAAHTHQ